MFVCKRYDCITDLQNKPVFQNFSKNVKRIKVEKQVGTF